MISLFSRRIPTVTSKLLAQAHPRSPSFRPHLEILEGRTLPAIVTWINPAGGDWDTASNWDAGQVPTASDDAVIDMANISVTHGTGATDTVNSLNSRAVFAISAGSMSLTAASTFQSSLNLSGGALMGAGNQTIQGLFSWSNGTLSGPGHTLAQGGIALGGTGASGGPTVDNRALDNAGVATLTGTLNITSLNGATFTNLVGATFQADADVTFGGVGATFQNAGTFHKSAGSGITNMTVPFNNSGSVQIDTGTVMLNTGTGSGAFNAASGATLEFAGAYSLNSASAVSGGGTVRFSAGGTITVDGTYTVTNTILAGFTVNFTHDLTLVNITLAGGTLGGNRESDY
jgi:hypothetical protein